MLLRYLSSSVYCGICFGKGYCGISLEKFIALSFWKRLLRYMSGKGYSGICMEKVIAVSA